MKVLVMQQKMLGDVLTSTLLCDNLRARCRSADIHFLAHDGARPVLIGHPAIDRVHGYPARAGWRERWAVARTLRRERFDAVIDVYAKWESLILVAASGAARTIGYRKPYTRPVYTDPVARTARSQHGLPLAIEHRLQLLAPLLGPVDIATLVRRPRLYVQPDERAAARRHLDAHRIDRTRPLLMISALGSEPRKSYPLPSLARLIDRIAARSEATLLFNSLPSQRGEVEALHALCAESTRARIALDACPRGLRDFIAVLAECRALVGNEGGAVNMARALDVPSFSIFSPWIDKSVWGIDDDGRHPAVHLADFAPDLVAGMPTATLKQNATALYARFRPDWIEPALDRFLDSLHPTPSTR